MGTTKNTKKIHKEHNEIKRYLDKYMPENSGLTIELQPITINDHK